MHNITEQTMRTIATNLKAGLSEKAPGQFDVYFHKIEGVENGLCEVRADGISGHYFQLSNSQLYNLGQCGILFGSHGERKIAFQLFIQNQDSPEILANLVLTSIAAVRRGAA